MFCISNFILFKINQGKDDFGEGKLSSVTLMIRVLDDNDNRPSLTVRDYESYVEEGQMQLNPLVVVQVQLFVTNARQVSKAFLYKSAIYHFDSTIVLFCEVGHFFMQASDTDSSSRVSYSIVSGDNNGLWRIDSSSGEVTATRAVTYAQTPSQQGR